VLYETYVFWSLLQGDGEPINSFLKRLKTQAKRCEFVAMNDRMLLCRVVFGLTDVRLKERLLRDNELTLVRAMDDIRAAEMTHQQMTKLAEGDKAMITSIHAGAGVAAVRAESAARQSSVRRSSTFSHLKKQELINNCKYCTYNHVRGRCPAFGKQCKRCGGINHFQKACNMKTVNAVQGDMPYKVDSLFIGTIAIDSVGVYFTSLLDSTYGFEKW